MGEKLPLQHSVLTSRPSPLPCPLSLLQFQCSSLTHPPFLFAPSLLQFQCFCVKNWYPLNSCRIDGEPSTQFPFQCSLSQLMRSARLLKGVEVRDEDSGETRVVHVREHSFLDNPRVPQETRVRREIGVRGGRRCRRRQGKEGARKVDLEEARLTPLSRQLPPNPHAQTPTQEPSSRLVVVPSSEPRPPHDPTPPALVSGESVRSDGSTLIEVPWPLDDLQLRSLLAPFLDRFRVIHLANATKVRAFCMLPSFHACFIL